MCIFAENTFTGMKKRLFIFVTVLLFAAKAQCGKHYTVVLSLDGYRWDYTEWYDTPFMDMMASKGVKSGLIPSYPSKTFPNHYTLATGLYPDHHGIVANSFLDRSTGETFSLGNSEQKINPVYYGGEPIWNTAKRQGIKTAVFYWPGSDVCVGGSHPDTYYVYDKKPRLTIEQRLDGIISQLSLPEKERPQLIMGYVEEPDGCGHNYGPHDKRTRKMVEKQDSMLTVFYNKMIELPIADDINLIVLSDHGMAWVPKANNIAIGNKLKDNWIVKVDGSIPANIYVKQGYTDSVYNALKNISHAKVWKRNDIPKRLHYGTNSRVGDIVVDPELGYVIYDKPTDAGGAHGFDPAMNDIHALFRAMGPDFKNIEIPHFANVNVYSLLCRLLGIKPAKNDGNIEETSMILQ